MSDDKTNRLAALEKSLFEYNGPDRVVHFTEFLELTKKSKRKGLAFGSTFPNFDSKLGAFETGRVVVVSGHAKNGKTLFAESWIRGMLRRDEMARAMILSFEIEVEKLLLKYESDPSAGVHVPLQLEAMNFDWLYKRCLEAKLKYDCRIVMIDHLHFMVDMATKQNMSLNIGGFMRRLKFDIAMKMGLAVILIAHQEKGRNGEEASMNGARDSSFVGQECDAFVVVTRRKNFTEKDFREIEGRIGFEACLQMQNELVQKETDPEDKFSHGLAMVKVEVSRMSGAFGAQKLFRKVGDFLEEV